MKISRFVVGLFFYAKIVHARVLTYSHVRDIISYKVEGDKTGGKTMENIIKSIEGSELWIGLNKRIKALYEAEGREATEEEYQAVRNMMIYKVMLEDPEVIEAAAKSVYEELRNQ